MMDLTQNSGSVTHTIVLGAPAFPPTTVCRVTGDMRTWRVTLGAPRYSDATLVVPGGMIANAELLPDVSGLGTAPGAQNVSARIVWGTANAAFEVDVDWGSGSTFCVTATYVQVINNPINLGGAANTRITFPAQIGPAESASPPWATPPTFTKRFGTLGPGAVGSVGIPNYARSFYIARESSPTPAEIFELFITSADGASSFYRFEQQGPGATRNNLDYAHPIMIPGGALAGSARLTYRNGPGAAGIVQPVAIFNLDIG